jgi:hypothetical protein
MPIATLIVREDAPELAVPLSAVVDRWSAASGVTADYMTVNMLPRARQAGARYAVMAFLYLPTLWSAGKVDTLQLSLAQALAECFTVAPDSVQVVTTMVESGHAIEDGRIQTW